MWAVRDWGGAEGASAVARCRGEDRRRRGDCVEELFAPRASVELRNLVFPVSSRSAPHRKQNSTHTHHSTNTTIVFLIIIVHNREQE